MAAPLLDHIFFKRDEVDTLAYKQNHETIIIMTFKEAQEFLRISRPTLTELVKRGEIPARKLGNQWRFSKQALIEYLHGKDHVSRSRRK